MIDPEDELSDGVGLDIPHKALCITLAEDLCGKQWHIMNFAFVDRLNDVDFKLRCSIEIVQA